MLSQSIVFWLVIVVIAVGLAAVLILAWRRYAERRPNVHSQWPKVYVLGTFSPVLSGLKHWRQLLGQVRWPL